MALQNDQQKHISDWQASGLSQAVYRRANGLNGKTFGNWVRARHGRDDSARPARTDQTLAGAVKHPYRKCRVNLF
jgi:hypothetical protein